MIGITVADLATSLSFYKLLGWEVELSPDSGPHVEFVLPTGLRIAWDSEELIKEIDPHWVKPVGQRMSMAFRFDSAPEVDAKYQEIVAAGFQSHKEPWDAFWGQRYAQVKDPDGNVVDLFAWLSSPA